jgi:hypothetical protein
LLTRLASISVAPEAQRWLAPRFSVGESGQPEPISPVGAKQTEICNQEKHSCDCPEVSTFLAPVKIINLLKSS